MIDINYDFTEETATNYLKQIDDKTKKELLEKYLKSKNTFEKYIIYRELKCIDPDDKSKLLQEIYFNKWDKKYLNACIKKDNIVFSDTMTSVQGLINNYYMALTKENEGIKNEWIKYKQDNDLNKGAHFSEKSMIYMYKNIKKYPCFEKEIVNNKSMVNFISKYHTIGNYIPVPNNFNCARSGHFSKHDMWDLTLIKICEYYNNHSEQTLKELLHIKELTKENKIIIENTKKWLDTYKDDKEFIAKNYLKVYITKKEELNKIHNWKNSYPKLDDYNKYFEILSEIIEIRGNDIIK